MKEKIVDYLKTEDEDYFSFVRTLSKRKVDIIKNTEAKGVYVETWPHRKYLSQVTGRNCNIFFFVKEVDFTRFSWNFVLMYSKDSELLNLMKIINEINDEVTDKHLQFRIKRLRINIFNTLNYVGSPFFDVEVYKRCVDSMNLAMKKLNEYLCQRVKVLSTTYDSVAFLGEFDFEDLKKVLAPCLFKVREYSMFVHFRNILAIEYLNGGWDTKYMTGTKHDAVKEKVVSFLKKLEFSNAIMELNKADLPMKIKQEYIKDVLVIAKCPKCKGRKIIPCPGSTCKKPLPHIQWICQDCLWEW